MSLSDEKNETRAKLRAEWKKHRQMFCMEPTESLAETVLRFHGMGVENVAREFRDVMNNWITCRNANAHLAARLRDAVGERDGLEEHLRLALEEAKMHKDQRTIAEAALHRTCDERDALKKQLRGLKKQLRGLKKQK